MRLNKKRHFADRLIGLAAHRNRAKMPFQGQMISLKTYLDSPHVDSQSDAKPASEDLLSFAVKALRSSLVEMGNCSLCACPPIGKELQQSLGKIEARLERDSSREALESTERSVQQHLQDWGRRTAGHYRRKTEEVRELLIVMAHTAESVGARDVRYSGQMNDVTARLQRIATLEDLTEIRSSIKASAVELKTSIDRMAAEGKAVVDQLRKDVSVYQAKLEEAEETASRDTLTGLRSRVFVENQIVRRIADKVPLSVAIVDIDGFKKVNDDHGHLVGDELLKQFATELQSACRSIDVIGRWGGDEFIILLDCDKAEATAQIDRLRNWICGNYTVQGRSGPSKLRVDASIGLADHRGDETIKQVLARADAAMYRDKAASRTRGSASKSIG
jgi:diguanylate cyclase (GGDEF)-like protein